MAGEFIGRQSIFIYRSITSGDLAHILRYVNTPIEKNEMLLVAFLLDRSVIGPNGSI